MEKTSSLMTVLSPNLKIQPATASINAAGHLVIGGCDTVELAQQFGTPLWIIDQETVRLASEAALSGLKDYPHSRVLYAGKAFLNLAMCHLLQKFNLGLDVVSAGELHTAVQAMYPAHLIYMHGNNKSPQEITDGLAYGEVNIVVDNQSELHLVQETAARLNRRANILLRVTPGVEPDTHHYIRTGQSDSKFGIALESLNEIVEQALSQPDYINLLGLHAHIGSQSHELEPYREIVEIMADCFAEINQKYKFKLSQLDVGGGLGIAYTENDRPTPIYEWSLAMGQQVKRSFLQRNLDLPMLLLEPGRCIVGTAGVTLYRAGHQKRLPSGMNYLAVDGGMADNPRPVMYEAKYTAAVANRMNDSVSAQPVTIVGKYCESGDIIVKDTLLAATTDDLIAVFGTGAYNYSMASNYNRTGRPACVLVSNGQADVILERESHADLLRQDRVPARLLND